MKNWLIFIFFSLQIAIFAQKPFHAAVKTNPFTMLTGRYGANVEIPLSKDFSATLEGRYLTKDWDNDFGDISYSFRDAKGINTIIGLRYYIPVEKRYRWYVSAEYRYKYSKSIFFDNAREDNEGNIITGIQLLSSKTNFTIDLGIGSGIANSKRTSVRFNFSDSEPKIVVRFDILVGYKF